MRKLVILLFVAMLMMGAVAAQAQPTGSIRPAPPQLLGYCIPACHTTQLNLSVKQGYKITSMTVTGRNQNGQNVTWRRPSTSAASSVRTDNWWWNPRPGSGYSGVYISFGTDRGSFSCTWSVASGMIGFSWTSTNVVFDATNRSCRMQ